MKYFSVSAIKSEVYKTVMSTINMRSRLHVFLQSKFNTWYGLFSNRQL